MNLRLHRDDPIRVGQLFHLEPSDYDRSPYCGTGSWAVVVVPPVKTAVARLLPISTSDTTGHLIPQHAMWELPDGGWVMAESATIDPQKLRGRPYGGILSAELCEQVSAFHRRHVERNRQDMENRRLMRVNNRQTWPGKAPTL